MQVLDTKRSALPSPSTFNLGKWSWSLTVIALVWILSELAMLTLPKEFHGGAKVVLGVLLSGAIVYFLVVRKHVVAGKAGIQNSGLG